MNEQLQLQLNAERHSKNYSNYQSVPDLQKYVAASPKYVPKSSDLEQSVEADPLAMLSANRLELAKMKVSMLASQISDRRYVHGQSLTGIETDELTCLNEIHKIGDGDYESVRQIRLDQLLRLQKERREEHVSYFRDTSKIGKDLIDAILEYKSVSNRGEILNGM